MVRGSGAGKLHSGRLSSRGPDRSPAFTIVSIDGSGAAGTRAIHERQALLPQMTSIEGVDGRDRSTLAVRRRRFCVELRTDRSRPTATWLEDRRARRPPLRQQRIDGRQPACLKTTTLVPVSFGPRGNL